MAKVDNLDKFLGYLDGISLPSDLENLRLHLSTDCETHKGDITELKFPTRQDHPGDFGNWVNATIRKWREVAGIDADDALKRLKKVFENAGKTYSFNKAMKSAGLAHYIDSSHPSVSSGNTTATATLHDQPAPAPPKLQTQPEAKQQNLTDETAGPGTFQVAKVPEEIPSYSWPPGRKPLVVIINNETFRKRTINEKKVTLDKRTGTQYDEDKIRETIAAVTGIPQTEEKGPNMFVFRDNKTKDLKVSLQTAKDKSDFAYLCCFVLSHGTERMFCTNNGSMKIDELTDIFKGKIFEDKAKLFFVQTCQGGKTDTDEISAMEDDDDDKRVHPFESDIFIFYATPFGYKAFRYQEFGTRFIQSLCEALKQLFSRRVDLCDIATCVNEMVPHFKAPKDYNQRLKQISMWTSTLRKKFYFQ